MILPTAPCGFPPSRRRIEPSKELGADNEAIFRDWLGLDEAAFGAHRKAGAF